TTTTYTLSLHDALPIFEIVEAEHRYEDADREQRAIVAAQPELELLHAVVSAERGLASNGRLRALVTMLRSVISLPTSWRKIRPRSEEHTSELQSPYDLV